MSKSTVIVSGYIQNQAKVDAYKSVAGPILQKYGATLPPKSYTVHEVIAGITAPSFMLEIVFPDRETAIAAFNDPDYLAVISERDEGFGDLSILIVE